VLVEILPVLVEIFPVLVEILPVLVEILPVLVEILPTLVAISAPNEALIDAVAACNSASVANVASNEELNAS
jgi:hypothetical protein